MRWITREVVTGALTDEQHDQAWRDWERNRISVRQHLTGGTRDLIDAVNLHDAIVAELKSHEDQTVSMLALVGDLQRGYEWLAIRYLDAVLIGVESAAITQEVIIDEVELGPTGEVIHSLLLDFGEIAIAFRGLELTRRPATSQDRSRLATSRSEE